MTNEVTVSQPSGERAIESAPRRSDTLDEAVARLRESRSVPAQREAMDQPTRTSPAVQPIADEGAMWTNEDVQHIAMFQSEAKRFHDDVQRFAQVSKINLDELAKTDKGKAAAIRVELDQMERELRQRHEVLARAKAALESKVVDRNARKVTQFLSTQRATLEERVPNLDKAALRGYLARIGFSDPEIAQAYDARIVELAEKARRYDDLTSSDRKKLPPIPGVRGAKPATRSTKLEEARSCLERTGSLDAAYDFLQAAKQQRAPR